MPESFNTSDQLRRAWEEVEKSGIPESLWVAALPLAFGVLGRANGPAGSKEESGSTNTKKRTAEKLKSSVGGGSDSNLLSGLAEQGDLFQRIVRETDVSIDDLGDMFHISEGHLHIKVASNDLGSDTKAATMTVTSLLAGAVFAGTDHPSLPISEVHRVCKAKRCHHKANASKYVKSTPSIATIGSQGSLQIVPKSGWQDQFAKAVGRVLGEPAGGS